MATEKEGGLGSRIYSGAATYGKFKQTAGSIIALLIGLGLIAGSIYFIQKPQVKTVQVDGRALNVECKQVEVKVSRSEKHGGDYMKTTTRCVYSVVFPNEKGEDVTINGLSRDSVLHDGDVIKMEYEEGKALDAKECCRFTNLQIAAIFGGFGALFLLGAGFSWYMRRFEFINAARGGADAVGLVADAL